ncbi:RNA-binding domain-containing protein [Ascobolus immersus RN42]|uniref:RNA-binding domain-containing protein n=1 Tax=Ascobolus immersus RN42 TaxID=1160509 RepID=A0A3N4HXI1_ASCIM|nr:RNA-binding domain-containing protein [Ascobolus immersus RN42]
MFSLRRLALQVPKTSTKAFAPVAARAVTLSQSAILAQYRAPVSAIQSQCRTYVDIQRAAGPKPAEGVQESRFPPSHTLFVANLFYDITPEEIQQFVDQVAPSISCRIQYDQRGLSKGFAYVEFSSVEEATKVKEALGGQMLKGRTCHLHYANAKQGPRFQAPESNVLYLGNLYYNITNEELLEAFNDISNCIDIRVATDKRTNQAKGFAHAEFVDTASAVEAKKLLSGRVIGGRRLRVDFARGKDSTGAGKAAPAAEGQAQATEQPAVEQEEIKKE